MGRIYNNIKRIFEKNDEYATKLIEDFITLVTFEDVYLMKKRIYVNKRTHFTLKKNGNDMFIDCINFGIIIDTDDNVSIHT